jgi:hypothetical protein
MKQAAAKSASPDSNSIEFDGFGNCGGFAIIKTKANRPSLIPSNSTGLKTPAKAA